ncbi:fimbrial protein [Haemophilus influenzae]|uniref:fimbrial protein n=1 Tax=Haemophilus influenzae TaxID=727 RepID=UPI000D01E6B3|nr:fimbrial protein [Haemophilus influenzae]PRM49453.1 Neisseria PilC protein [Haemophilus influenzae]
MKTLKSSPLHLSLLPYLMGLLFLFSAYPAMAGPKQAHSEDKLYGRNKTKTFTFNGNSSLIAKSSQPEVVLFSKARDNTKYDTFSSNTINGSFTPFNSLGTWINTTVTGDSGYAFEGFSCTQCPKMTLPLDFYFNQGKLTKTDQVSDTGDTIFQLKEHPELGVSFQLGTQHQGNTAYLPPLQFDGLNSARIGEIEIYFGNYVSIVFLLRARLHVLGNNIINNTQDIPLTDLNLGHIQLIQTETVNNKGLRFIVKDNGNIAVHLQPPKIRLIHQQRQCYLSNNGNVPRTVTLTPVKKSRFDTENEIEGGSFSLRVSCNKTENQIKRQWLFPRVMITFKGEQDTTNNGSSDLLKTQKGDGQAEGVSLKIKREGGEAVTYGEDSPRMGNPGQFAVHQQPSEGDKNARETFKVYYVKDPARGSLTEGKVNATATFTMSYQ